MPSHTVGNWWRRGAEDGARLLGLDGGGAGLMKHKTEAQELAQIELARRGAIQRNPIYEPSELIKLALERHGSDKVAVSWSGGRCSTVILHMALQICPDIRVFHTDHGVHYPETSRYVRRMAKEWNLNLAIAKPERTFWEIVKEKGFPKPRVPMDPKRGQSAVRTPACCRWLKEKPLADFRKKEGIEAFIVGMRAAEARIRALSMYQKGQFYLVKKLKAWKYNPIAFWITKELVSYCQANDVPISPIYKTAFRSGCWPCTAFVGWRDQLMRTNPKYYDFMVKKLGGQQMLDHFYRTRVEPPCHTERGGLD